MQLEQRLSKQIALARKHHVSPEELPDLHQTLLAEFKQINQQDEQSEQLKNDITKYHQIAVEIATKLHQKRLTISKTLAKKVTTIMHDLSMPNGQFSIDVAFDENRLNEDGADQVTFLVSTNGKTKRT